MFVLSRLNFKRKEKGEEEEKANIAVSKYNRIGHYFRVISSQDSLPKMAGVSSSSKSF